VEADLRIQRLGRSFFARQSHTVARDLLGVWLIRSTPDGLSGGPIVEVEAYGGPEDKASHSRAGRTKRTAPMFGEVGHAYVYLVYGMHNCLNVVAYDSSAAVAGAVLIRAIEPGVGLDRANPRICAGPALVCRGLGVTRAFDGYDLVDGQELWLAAPSERHEMEVASGPRIGVDYAGPGWTDRPWRFWVAGNASVSKR
jgi:DNA-3-methyladenine glycosylase